MSTDTGSEPRKKHRHDLGHEDHGPVVSAGTTRGIQGLLAVCIATTLVLVLWFFVDATRAARTDKPGGATPAASSGKPARPTSPSTTR